MKILFLISMCVIINCLEDNLQYEDLRKHYGLSFYNSCGDYVKTFKCMTACKSVGYKIFRLSYTCKCSCHEMKTSTILPFFMWRTNGTTRKLPKTYGPQLYQVVGTLFPPESLSSDEDMTTIGVIGGATEKELNDTDITQDDDLANTTPLDGDKDGNGTASGNATTAAA